MNFKKPLLTLTVACALVGGVASNAGASPGQYIHSKYPNSAHAVQTATHELTVDGQGAHCNAVELDGATQNSPATELTLTPSYKECTVFGIGGANALINPNGCTYRLTQPEGFADNWSGGFAIKCPEGKKIVLAGSVFGSECKAEIGEQTLASGLAYENDTTEGKLDLAFNLSGIKVTKVLDNGLCALGGTGTVNNSTYVGGSTAEAASGGNLAVGVYGPGEFLNSKYPSSAHAVQTVTHKFTVDGQAAECKTVELNGTTQNGPASELTLTPTYKECTVFGIGGANALINPNGCTYRLTQPEGFADNWTGGFAIKCPEGKKLVIESSVAPFTTCKVEIGEQTPSGIVAYENDTTEGKLDLAFNLSGIKVTKVLDNGLCPLSGTGTVNNSTYVGGSTAEAASGGSLAVGVYGPGEFLHSKYPNSAHAVQAATHEVTVDGQGAHCNAVEFNGATQNGPASELTLTPTYKECTVFGIGGASINPNGCTYRLTQPEGFADNWSGGFAIKCPEGKKIVLVGTVFGSECKAEIGEQTPSGSVTYENNTSEGKLALSLNLSTIKVTRVTDNGLCPMEGVGVVNNGTYVGGSTAEAASGGNLFLAG